MKHKQHKRHVYQQDLNIPCEIAGCEGRHFSTLQAFHGHLRMIHGIHDKVIPSSNPGPGVQNDQQTIEGLKNEVERLQLEVKKRRLQADFPATSRESPDLTQQLGLGSFDPEVKAQTQRRALALSDQGQQQITWIDRLLSNSEGVKIAIEGLKGILGVGHNNNGDNMATLLKEMGYSLKDLITNASAPKSGSLEIAGMNLQGVSLSPTLLVALLEYKGKVLAAEKAAEGQKSMADTLANVFEKVSGMISRGELRMPGPGRSIAQEVEPLPVVDDILTCPTCGYKNKLSSDLVPGMEIRCQGPDCKELWHTVDDHAQLKPQRQVKERPARVEEPEPQTINCPSCGQLLDVEGRRISESVQCPACQKEYVLTSAEDPLSEAEKASKEFLHR